MTGLRAHDFECARDVMRAAAQSSTDESGAPSRDKWDGFNYTAMSKLIPRHHGCHCLAAQMVIWLLARQIYATPADLEAEMGVLLGPMILGESP